MKKILLASTFLVLLAAGCSSSYQASTPSPVAQTTNPSPTPIPPQATPAASPQPTPAATAPAASPTPAKTPAQTILVLKLGNSSTLGKYLTAANGMTLYTSSSDSANTSNCSGSCASSWPPYTLTAGAQLGAAVGISGLLGTIIRADGTTQLTYKSMPLYFWSNDAKAGDTTGQGVGPFTVAVP